MTAGVRDTVNLLVEQVLFCSHLLLTKSDRIPQDKLTDIATYIQQINPYSSVHSVLFGKLDIESLFDLEEYDYNKVAKLVQELKPVIASESKKDRPYNLATRVIKDDRPFHPKRLWDVCHQYLDKTIYRSKGFFWLASRDKFSLLWNQSAGDISLEIIGSWRAGIIEDDDHGLTEMEIEALREILKESDGPFGDRSCDLTIIGDESQVDQFAAALETCFLDLEEIELWLKGEKFEDPWPKNIVKLVN